MANTVQTRFKQAKTGVDRLGNRQLQVGKKFTISGWMLFDGIALIIIISVAAVRLTHAGVDYTFMRTAQQMEAGTLGRSVAAGEYRRLSSNGIHAETSAEVTADELAASSQICAQMHVSSADTFADIQFNGHYASKFATSAGDVTVCVAIDKSSQGGKVYAGTSGKADVYSIYGSK